MIIIEIKDKIKKILRQKAVLLMIFKINSLYAQVDSAAASSEFPVSSFSAPPSSGAASASSGAASSGAASTDYSSYAEQAVDKVKDSSQAESSDNAKPANQAPESSQSSQTTPAPAHVVQEPSQTDPSAADGNKPVTPKDEPSKEVTYGGFSDRMFGRVVRVSHIVRAGANDNNAILVELVNIISKDVESQVSSISMKDWFNYLNPNIEKLKESEKVQVFRWQIVPEPDVEESLIKVNSNAIKSFLFIRYHNNSATEPYVLNPFKNTLLVFESDVFEIKQFPKESGT